MNGEGGAAQYVEVLSEARCAPCPWQLEWSERSHQQAGKQIRLQAQIRMCVCVCGRDGFVVGVDDGRWGIGRGRLSR